jgi:hypothetical protein
MAFDLNTFNLHGTTLPAARVAAMTFAVVNEVEQWALESGGLHAEQAMRAFRKAGVTDPSEWEVVGSRFTDLSGWCPHEGKMEYHSETLLLMVRKSDHKAARVAYLAEQAKPLTHNPFASLAV